MCFSQKPGQAQYSQDVQHWNDSVSIAIEVVTSVLVGIFLFADLLY